MEITEVQRQAVREWVKQGASLSDVQRRLLAEFELKLTYMDVRLLVLDIGVALKDKPEPRPLAPPPAAAQPGRRGVPEPVDAEADEDRDDDGSGSPFPPEGQGAGASSVKVTLDRVVQAGALASGEVVFSDATKVRWMLDQMGRLGLVAPDHPGYRPPQADIQEFQLQLRDLLAKRGY